MDTLRSKIIRLAHANPELRPHLLPLVTKTARNSFEFLLSVKVNHDMADAVNMDRGRDFDESYVELLRHSLRQVENFVNGERVGRSVLKVKRIESKKGALSLLIEASPPPVTEGEEESILYGAEKLLKAVLREEFNRDGGEWLYLDTLGPSDLSVEVL